MLHTFTLWQATQFSQKETQGQCKPTRLIATEQWSCRQSPFISSTDDDDDVRAASMTLINCTPNGMWFFMLPYMLFSMCCDLLIICIQLSNRHWRMHCVFSSNEIQPKITRNWAMYVDAKLQNGIIWRRRTNDRTCFLPVASSDVFFLLKSNLFLRLENDCDCLFKETFFIQYHKKGKIRGRLPSWFFGIISFGLWSINAGFNLTPLAKILKTKTKFSPRWIFLKKYIKKTMSKYIDIN